MGPSCLLQGRCGVEGSGQAGLGSEGTWGRPASCRLDTSHPPKLLLLGCGEGVRTVLGPRGLETSERGMRSGLEPAWSWLWRSVSVS